jgi:hypothetical protein
MATSRSKRRRFFPARFLERFLKEAGEDAVLSEKAKTRSGWRYGFTQSGKRQFVRFVERRARRADLAQFGEV